MPLDMSQFLRNSISVDRYDAMRNATLDTSKGVAQTGETGSLMGTTFVVEQNPIAELMDSMEELSFQFEENEMKSVGERKLGETRGKDNPYLRALENWLKTLPDMPGESYTLTASGVTAACRHPAAGTARNIPVRTTASIFLIFPSISAPISPFPFPSAPEPP